VSYATDCHQRDNLQCFKCGKYVHPDWDSCHHRRLRSGGGEDVLSNLIMLCGSGTTGCHGYVHHNRTEAAVHGWIVSRYGPAPADVPVRHHQLGEVYLTDDGQILTPDLYRAQREEETSG
jgi:hypothetical protein